MEYRTYLLLLLSVASAVTVKIDTDSGSEQNSYRYHTDSQSEDSFNPGHTQHGGWHKPEDSSNIGIAGGNQWKVNDYSAYLGSQSQYQPSQLEQGTSYQQSNIVSGHHTVLSTGKVVDPSQGQYSPTSSLNHGGDLVVGLGSVQRPASAGNQYQAHFNPEPQIQQPAKKVQPSKQYTPNEYAQFTAQQQAARPTFAQQPSTVVKNVAAVQKQPQQPQPVYNPYKTGPVKAKIPPTRPVFPGPPPKNVGIGTYRPGPPQQYHQNLRRKQGANSRVGTENLRRGSSNPGVKFPQQAIRGQASRSRIYLGP